jgi:hypothetical protein
VQRPARLLQSDETGIEKTYDQYPWCYHCSAQDHKTSTCTREAAKFKRAIWEGGICTMMEDWIERDQSQPQPGTNGTEWEMVDAVAVCEPPKATPWCVFCSVFGHSASYQCPDKSEWLSRAPLDCKRQVESILSGNPAFVPNQTWAQYLLHENLTWQDEISVPCRHCSTALSSPRLAPKDCSVFCPTCSLQNHHPSSCPSPSHSDLNSHSPLAQTSDFRDLLALFSASKKAPNAPPPPRRPSAAALPLWNWPQTQPHYGNPLYDAPGNSQPYFLPTKLYLCQHHLDTAVDQDAPINRAGPQGGRAVCYRCWAIAATYDAEDDVVMACTDPANVVGCGEGENFFDHRAGFKGCRCAGGVPALGYALAAAT